MNDLINIRTRLWAGFAIVLGVGLFLGREMYEEPDLSALDLFFELLEIIPLVLTSVGVAVLFVISQRQREETLNLMKDIELARAQGEKWRNNARPLIEGLGKAIDEQFLKWSLTEAESEVALLLLKGLSLKEVATIRNTSERTIRAQARSLYSKSGLTGRAALSAFFLEDLLAPIEGSQ